MNNNENVKSAMQRVNEMSNNNSNRNFQRYDNYREKVNAIVTLEDVNNINSLVEGAENLNRAINDSLKGLEDSSKEYQKMSELYKLLVDSAKELSNKENDAATNAKIINNMYNAMSKNQSSMSKQATAAAKQFLDDNERVLEIANSYKDIMRKSSESFSKNLTNNLIKVKDEVRNIVNAFNLQQLVTGGLSFNDLRKMQSNLQISMNLDQTGFMGVQSELLSQNKQISSITGDMYLSFNDAVSYMSNISEYNMKNYSQMTQMYKQVAMGTKYLGISNTNIGNLVKATNAIADDSFMNRQLAIVSALSSDSSLSEDVNSVLDFIGSNATSVNARYANSDDMLSDSIAIKTASDALFGNESKLVDSLMSEIMGKSDFSQLSESTKTLLAYTGQATNVMQQMRSGSVDLQNIVQGVLSGTNGLNQYQRTTLENFGLSDWVTLGGSYTSNKNEFLETLNYQSSLLEGINLKSDEELQAYMDEQAERADTRTGYEKFMDRIANSLGLQNQNWTSLLGFVQGINAIVSSMSGIISGYQIVQLMAINRNTAITAGKSTLSGSGGISKLGGLGSKLNGLVSGIKIGNAQGFSALGGVGLIAGGTALGISDAIKMQGSTGLGPIVDSARGFFLGTGSTSNTSEENAKATLGNTGKLAAIGAGIGTLIAPGVGTAIGGVIGGFAGLIGGIFGSSLEDNTEALEENTKIVGKSSDSIATNSALARIYMNNSDDQGSGGVSYGTGSGGVSNNYGVGGSYPWTVTSGYGPRGTIYKDGKAISSGFHHGIDFGIAQGTKLGAAVDGIVTKSGWNKYGGGFETVIQADSGKFYRYFHQVKQPPVSIGTRVSAGDIIGYSGTTGNSTGPHLHFQVDNGGNSSSVNPEPYITSALFKADGKEWNSPISTNATAVNDDSTANASTSLFNNDYSSFSKESTFSVSTNGKGGASDEPKRADDYAKSSDIDRLIDAIIQMKEEQNDQRAFLQALSGKNSFTFTM